MGSSLWTTPDRTSYFLVNDDQVPAPGDFAVARLDGSLCFVSREWILLFQISEAAARVVATEQLGQTLDELKHAIDGKLIDVRQQLDERMREPVSASTTLTPSAAPALLNLLKRLPGLIGQGLSRDKGHVETARTTMADLQRQLKDAGIDLDDRFTRFPDRLSALRDEFEARRRSK